MYGNPTLHKENKTKSPYKLQISTPKVELPRGWELLT